MPLKQYKAFTPVRRFRQSASYAEITKDKPEKSLTERKLRQAGRNAQGRVTTRHRGGGEKRRYRIVDFKRTKDGIPARVLAIDTTRTARAPRAARDATGRELHPRAERAQGGDSVSRPEPRPAWATLRSRTSRRTKIHGVEPSPAAGPQLVRAAGGMAQLVAGRRRVRADPSFLGWHPRRPGAVPRRSVRRQVEHENQKVGGAGHKRRMGWRPAVRGVVMSPRDHPHGGGEAKSPVGGMAQTPWGKPAMGLKTRRNPKTDRFVTERPKKRKSK